MSHTLIKFILDQWIFFEVDDRNVLGNVKSIDKQTPILFIHWSVSQLAYKYSNGQKIIWVLYMILLRYFINNYKFDIDKLIQFLIYITENGMSARKL